MSGVTPADYSYINSLVQDYRRSAQDAEDAAEKTVDKVKENADEEADRLSTQQSENLQDQADSYERTIQNLRSTNARVSEDARRTAAQQMSELKQGYDRRGNLVNDPHVDQIKVLEKELASREAHRRHQMGVSDEEHEKSIEDLSRRAEKKTESAVQAVKETYEKAYGDMDGSARTQKNLEKNETRKKYEDLSRSNQEDMQLLRKQAKHQVGDAIEDAETQKKRYLNSMNNNSETTQRRSMAKAERDIRTQKEAYAKELSRVTEDLKEVSLQENRFNKGKAEGTAETIKAFENEWRSRERVISENAENEIAATRRRGDEQEINLKRKAQNSSQAKDNFYTDVIRKQNTEHVDNEHLLNTVYNEDRKQMEMARKADRKFSSNNLEQQHERLTEQYGNTIKNTKGSYQNVMSDQKNYYESELGIANSQLQELKTTSRADQVSPGAEEAIRNSVIREYHKIATEDQGRTRRSVDQIRHEARAEKQSLVDHHKSDVNVIQKSNAVERDHERGEFNNHVLDLEMLKNETFRRQEEARERERAMMEKNYARTMEDQRRKYSEVIQNNRLDSENRVMSGRQDSQFKQTLMHRELMDQHNQTVRQYEMKLAAQKEQFDDDVTDVKSLADKKMRDIEREKKVALEVQARSYDQRIAQ